MGRLSLSLSLSLSTAAQPIRVLMGRHSLSLSLSLYYYYCSAYQSTYGSSLSLSFFLSTTATADNNDLKKNCCPVITNSIV